MDVAGPMGKIASVESSQEMVVAGERAVPPSPFMAFMPDQWSTVEQNRVRVTEELGGVDIIPAAFADHVRPEKPASYQPPLGVHNEQVGPVDQHAKIAPCWSVKVHARKDGCLFAAAAGQLDRLLANQNVGVNETEIAAILSPRVFSQSLEHLGDDRFADAVTATDDL